MRQNEYSVHSPTASIHATRARLAGVLVLLFLIVLLVAVLFPQAMPGEVVVIIARLLEQVISFYFRRGDA